MRTPLSERMARGLLGSLEKGGTSEGAARGWETRRGRSAVEDTPGEGRDPAAETPTGGHTSTPDEQSEVLVAPLRNILLGRGEIREMHKSDPRVRKMRDDIGEDGGNFNGGWDQALGQVDVVKGSEAFGTFLEGTKLVNEPSFHVVVRGDQREVRRRAAAMGKEFDQMAVGVAVRNPEGRETIFEVRLSPDATDAQFEKVMDLLMREKEIDSAGEAHGLSGATCMAFRSELRLIAENPEQVELIKRVISDLPSNYGAEITDQVRADVEWIGSDQYDEVMKDLSGDEVEAEIFFGGRGPRPTKLG